MTERYPQYALWTPVPTLNYEQSTSQPRIHNPKVPSQFHIDEVSASETLELQSRSFRQRWLGGLLLTLRAFASLSFCILVINLGWFVWAVKKYGVIDGYGTIQQGDCAATKSLNTWLHLAINILSTGLILSSTAFMQLVNSPSRHEIERAHQRHRWLSIGLLSPRNFFGVSKRKSLLCIILALSSVPFHLLYNSVIYSSLSANDYYWAVVTEGFLMGESFNLSSSNVGMELTWPVVGPGNISFSSTEQQWIEGYQEIQRHVTSYDRLEVKTCLQKYADRLVVDRRSLVLVSSDQSPGNSILSFDRAEINSEGSSDPINWVCSNDPSLENETCDPSRYLKNPSSWKVFNHTIEYCLSEQASESCAVKFSSSIAISVIICNTIKVLTMLYILFKVDIATTVTCTGDAIASFLTQDDDHTHNMSLASRRDFDQPGWHSVQIRRPPRHWGGAASRRRWAFTVLIMLTALLVVVIILAFSVPIVQSKGFDISASGLWKLGFGTVNPEILAFSDNTGTPATLALLANLPQLILACIYLTYNALFRLLFSAHDYSLFAFEAQYVMVSTPSGKQRGTWFLGFPMPWALPMLGLQVLLHWFVSQSFFVVQVSVFDEYGVLDNDFASISNCGFSPLAIICSILAAGIMMLLTIALGLRKFKAGSPPVVGNCSAAIAAACHPPYRVEAMPFRKLIWNHRAVGPGAVGYLAVA